MNRYLAIVIAFFLLNSVASAQSKLKQSISFATAPTIIVGQSGTVSATATSGLPLSFTTSTPKVCGVSGNVVQSIKAGPCIVHADQAGDATYNPAKQIAQTIYILNTQTIHFASAPVIAVSKTAKISAKASSGLTVTYASATPSVCSIKGNTVKGLAASTCIINANQPGNHHYTAAPQASQSFTISKDHQVIHFTAHPNLSVGSSGLVHATASSGLTVGFASSTPNTCAVSGNSVTALAVGLCAINASQPGDSNYNAAVTVSQSFNISKAHQFIQFGAAPTVSITQSGGITASSASAAISVTATSGLPVSLTAKTPNICSITGNIVTGITAGTCTISATQAGNANYHAAAQVSQAFPVTVQANSTANTPEVALFNPTGTNSLILAWLPTAMSIPANQVNYAIYLSTDNNFTPGPSNLFTSLIGKTQATLNGLSADTTYYALVTATDNKGNVISGVKYASAKTFAAPIAYNPSVPLVTSNGLKLGLHSQNGNVFSYAKTANSQAPAVNSVLVSQGSDGYQLLKVNNVTNTASKINVTTSPAALSEALDTATISSNMLLFDAGKNTAAATTAPGAASVQPSTTTNGSRYSQLKWENDLLMTQQTAHVYQDQHVSSLPTATPGQHVIALSKNAAVASASEEVSLTQTVTFEPNLTTELSWSALSGVSSGKLIASGTLTLDLKAIYDFKAAASYQPNPNPFPLTSKKYIALVMVGGLPVYQEVTLNLSASITASASAAINASAEATASQTISVGVNYDPVTETWLPLLDQTANQTLTVQLNINGGVQAEVRLIPSITVTYYKAVSGTLSVQPYLDATINAAQISSDPLLLMSLPATLQATQFDVNLAWQAIVSADLHTLFKNISVLSPTTVAGNSYPLYSLPNLQLQDLSGVSLAIGQAQPISLAVTNGANDSFNPNSIKWQVIPDNSSSTATITPQGCTATTGKPGGYNCQANLTVQAADNYHVVASGYGNLGEIGRQYVLGTISGSGCQIGQPGPAGGIIFYCDSTGQHGLEAAPQDQTPATWGCWGWANDYWTWTTVGNTSTAIGTGAANTAAIIAACGSGGGAGNGNPYSYGTASNAAAIAAAYTLNGYQDWYLPSRDELNQLYINQAVVGGFAYYAYWSSSENDYYYAWFQYFGVGYQDYFVKANTLGVRAVRAF